MDLQISTSHYNRVCVSLSGEEAAHDVDIREINNNEGDADGALREHLNEKELGVSGVPEHLVQAQTDRSFHCLSVTVCDFHH